MNKCPNPSYDLDCPHALSEDAPMPCMGSQEQCNEHREGVSLKRPEYPVDEAREELMKAINLYRKAYEVSRQDGDEEFAAVVLRMARGVGQRLLTHDLDKMKLEGDDIPPHLRDDASYLVCSGCGRKSFGGRLYEKCGMSQPDGSKCKGMFEGRR